MKTFRFVITEENGTTEMFQSHQDFLVHKGFLFPNDTTVCDAAVMHVKGDNFYLK